MVGEHDSKTSSDLARGVHQIGAVAFLAIAGFVLWEASHFRYLTDIGPGAGFFPIWIAALLAGLSVLLFVQASRYEVALPDSEFVPDRHGARRAISTLVALILFVWALERIGYTATSFAFSLALLVSYGRTRFVTSLALSVLVSGVLFYIFNRLLGVRLPLSPLGLWPEFGL